MSADILHMQRNGSPQTFLENALKEAPDMQWCVMAFLTRDGTLRCEWSQLPSNLQAIGAVEMLKRELME